MIGDTRFVAVAVVALTCVAAVQAAVIETVPVGNPGNADDPNEGYGGVAYGYHIGTFEVTAGQYAAFLNAVAATDTYGLYNPEMDSNDLGCQITRHGTSGSYTYDFSGRPSGTEADWVDRPVNCVSWGDAARFANWLHNGQPTGAPGPSTTEAGSYALNGATSDAALQSISRNPGATWVIPSEDEWYKAAYHANDGVTGSYYQVPTSSNLTPVSEPCPGGGNSANYADPNWALGPPYYRNNVGCYVGSAGPYGTFDQGGNVFEWVESQSGVPTRVQRGGSAYFSGSALESYHSSSYVPTYENPFVGFRVARISEQAPVPAASAWGTVAMALLVLTAGTLVWTTEVATRGPTRSSS